MATHDYTSIDEHRVQRGVLSIGDLQEVRIIEKSYSVFPIKFRKHIQMLSFLTQQSSFYLGMIICLQLLWKQFIYVVNIHILHLPVLICSFLNCRK